MIINRTNWRLHCQEPQLTADEWRRWEAVAQHVRTDREFADSVIEATEAEYQAEQTAAELNSWEGLAQWADAARRYRRAVIEAGERIPRCNHASSFSSDLEYHHNAYFRDYYRCRKCDTEVSFPECRFGGYVE